MDNGHAYPVFTRVCLGIRSLASLRAVKKLLGQADGVGVVLGSGLRRMLWPRISGGRIGGPLFWYPPNHLPLLLSGMLEFRHLRYGAADPAADTTYLALN